MWNEIIGHKEMFGMKFPDKICITKKDEEIAKKQIERFRDNWKYDEDKVKEMIFKIYEFIIPDEMICYINTSRFSSTCKNGKDITVSMWRSDNCISTTIIHEFSHIAFYKKWSRFCKKIGYTSDGIEEVKEFITIINNIEFPSINDMGYGIHIDIRKHIKMAWEKGIRMKEILSDPFVKNAANSIGTIK